MMNFNGPPIPFNKPEKSPKKETSLQLRLAAKLECLLLSKKITIEGKENLKLIPEGKKVIIASSHISDLDMVLAIKALCADFDIKVSGKSTNGTALIGKGNYLPIDYSPSNKGAFNPDNYTKMQSVLDSDKAVLIAAHNPSWGELPKRGGRGVAYLSQMGNYIILPVASDYQSSEPYKDGKNGAKMAIERAPAKVTIGKPIEIPKIEGFKEYQELSEKTFRGEKLTDEESVTFKNYTEILTNYSDIIMKSIASMLPEKKRGTYSEKEKKD